MILFFIANNLNYFELVLKLNADNFSMCFKEIIILIKKVIILRFTITFLMYNINVLLKTTYKLVFIPF